MLVQFLHKWNVSPMFGHSCAKISDAGTTMAQNPGYYGRLTIVENLRHCGIGYK